jgi:hypothetical protein
MNSSYYKFAAFSVIALSTLMCISAWSQRVGPFPYSKPQVMTTPEMFGEGIISTPTDEFGGCFSDDGRVFYFSKSVPGSYLYVICSSEFRRGVWSTPTVMPFSGYYRDFDPVLSPDGKRMIFASDRPVSNEVKTDYDLWLVERLPTGWSSPVHLDTVINSTSDEHFGSIAANGNIYFSSTRPGARGGADV